MRIGNTTNEFSTYRPSSFSSSVGDCRPATPDPGKNNSPSGKSTESSANFNDPEIRMKKKLGLIECKTCKERKYQDSSGDPGVSFKSPTHVSPENAGSMVMSHEQEHVTREKSKAQLENRKVLSQQVAIFSAVCPECGRIYVSGGKTTTTTASESSNKKDYFLDKMYKNFLEYFGQVIDTKV